MKYRVLMAAIILMVSGAAGFNLEMGKEKAAIIKLSGPIGSPAGILSTTSITPGEVRDLNERAKKKGADAIIYEINSGGGAVVASKEIMREIESVDIPTVCRFRDIAASGAYMAALGCDRIVADSSSLTGSIGVKASYLEYSGLLDKLGIEYVNVTAGRYKDAGSRYRNVTEGEKRILKKKTEAVHENFVSKVSEKRNLSREKVSKVRTGEVFLGQEAKELELVDRLGGRQTAVKVAENLTGSELNTFEVEKQEPFSFLDMLAGSAGAGIANSISPLKAIY